MPSYSLAFLGFGNVGRALARLLLHKQEELRQRYDLTFRVTAIATGRHGAVVDANGLDLAQALARVEQGASLGPALPLPEFLAASRADVLFETTPVNYETGQPAITALRTALQSGMHAVSANKGPVVHAYRELTDLATAHGVKFYFESAVMDGAPIFSLFREALPAVDLRGFRGILNSTTNLILTRMETGESFAEAVKYAQSIGIAETDPSGDVEGWDAAVKVAALATVLMGVPLKPQQVQRQGITALSSAEVARARQEGKRWKLVCTCTRDGDHLQARVAPERVASDSPFYGVNGTSSIVLFETDVLPGLSIVESDPGPQTTAYGLLADFLNIVRAR